MHPGFIAKFLALLSFIGVGSSLTGGGKCMFDSRQCLSTQRTGYDLGFHFPDKNLGILDILAPIDPDNFLANWTPSVNWNLSG